MPTTFQLKNDMVTVIPILRSIQVSPLKSGNRYFPLPVKILAYSLSEIREILGRLHQHT